MQGMQKLVLYTAAGGMDIVYLNQLGNRIKRVMVQSENISVLRHNENQLFEMQRFDTLPRPATEAFQKAEMKLRPFYEMDSVTLMRNRDNYGLREMLQEAVNKAIVNQVKQMVATKEPEFFIKDLNMESLDNLSNTYAERCGSDSVGVHVELSKYQKFFVIIGDEDLAFYMCETEKYDRAPSRCYFGLLVNLKPEKWVLGRYENLEYLKELSARTVSPI